MSSTEKSILDIIRKIDPDWDKERAKPAICYEFSNGRKFEAGQVYSTNTST